MKLTLKTTTASTLPKEYTRVELTEKDTTRFIERADTTVLSVGAGKRSAMNARRVRTLVRSIVRIARANKIEKLALDLEVFNFPNLGKWLDSPRLAALVSENALLADYEYTVRKSKQPSYTLKELALCGKLSKEEKAGAEHGVTVAEYMNLTRDIANTPGGVMTPALLAERAKEAVKGTRAKVTVFDKKRVEKEKMGALLGVASGSKHGPRFIIMEYWGAKKPGASSRSEKSEKPIVLVGKGITFDTGGLNLKPGDSMLDMHLDMAGGAAVIGAVAAIAKLGLKKNVIGLIPAAENSVSDDSMRPGDILTTLSGKTVDVLNTDAEGRLVLADALTYAKRYNPRLVLDVATLTGASLIALGEHASAFMTRSDTLRERLAALGEESGDYVWPLPMWDEYAQYTKGRFGDVANIPSFGNTRLAGSINGGMFLEHFADYGQGTPWAHIDMAPRMVSTASDKLAKGATGEPMRLLVKVVEEW